MSFECATTALERMLTEDGPHYANWDQDVTATDERYDGARFTVGFFARYVIHTPCTTSGT